MDLALVCLAGMHRIYRSGSGYYAEVVPCDRWVKMTGLFDNNEPQTRQWIILDDEGYKNIELNKKYLVSREHDMSENGNPLNYYDEELPPVYDYKTNRLVPRPLREVFVAWWDGEGWHREGMWLYKGKILAYTENLEPYIEVK